MENLDVCLEIFDKHRRKPRKTKKPLNELTPERRREYSAAIWLGMYLSKRPDLPIAKRKPYNQLIASLTQQKEDRQKLLVDTQIRHLETRTATMEQLIALAQKVKEIHRARIFLKIGTALLGGFKTDKTNGFNLDGMNTPSIEPKDTYFDEASIITKKELPIILGHTLATNIIDMNKLFSSSKMNIDMQKPNERTSPQDEIHQGNPKILALRDAENALLSLAQKSGREEELMVAYTAALQNPKNLEMARNLNSILQDIQKNLYISDNLTMYCLVLGKHYDKILKTLRASLNPRNQALVTEALVALAYVKTNAIYNIKETYTEVTERWQCNVRSPLDSRNIIRVIRKTLRDISPESKKLLKEIFSEADEELLDSYNLMS
jgi:hypothetical protein